MYFQVRLSIYGENLEKPIFEILLTFANVGTYIGLLANVGAWVNTFLYQLYNYIFALNQRVKYHLQSFPRVLPAKGQRYLNLNSLSVSKCYLWSDYLKRTDFQTGS